MKICIIYTHVISEHIFLLVLHQNALRDKHYQLRATTSELEGDTYPSGMYDAFGRTACSRSEEYKQGMVERKLFKTQGAFVACRKKRG